eukprot:TRINITY_DN8431_c0_g1_i1.p2 TRINITY_DN8431_c0_g1~~TRINITY_DN8431_c0_g1_i1.p2  ORF type:complete len:119 (+),score=8.66 TRINITY_DN8431_c0_g1_i1:446-802(+)
MQCVCLCTASSLASARFLHDRRVQAERAGPDAPQLGGQGPVVRLRDTVGKKSPTTRTMYCCSWLRSALFSPAHSLMCLLSSSLAVVSSCSINAAMPVTSSFSFWTRSSNCSRAVSALK